MDKYPPVTQFMATKLITFTPETDIRTVIDIMVKKKISGAPVLNNKNELVGMISEVDCLHILIDGPYNEEPSKNGTVGELMSKSVRTISSDKSILDAAYEFVNAGYKRLPVTENGKLVGQISRSDILRAVQEIKPTIKHVPDSWKGREPTIPNHKGSRFNKNA
jgi:CBS domain-containing protein